MTVTEAPAHGLPVIATAAAGPPEAPGCTTDGTRPGQLIPPGDPAAPTAALTARLSDQHHRHKLRAAARQRQPTLPGWNRPHKR
jgi:glycosyltransferase involved in cell wall biosynthesis